METTKGSGGGSIATATTGTSSTYQNNVGTEEEVSPPPTAEATQVELATLSLPPQAASQEGLVAGNECQLILEASKDTVDHMQQQVNDNQTLNSKEADEHPFQISAVVDLEKLSKLVGISEEDFITGLHQDVHHPPNAEEEKQDHSQNDDVVVIDEESPLLTDDKSSQKYSDHVETGSSVSSSSAKNKEQITLSADPFIERLAEVLPTVDEMTVLADDNQTYTHTEAAATTLAGGDGEEPQHLGHDAFLLKTNVDENHPNIPARFVLALPEIQLPPASVTTDLSEMSDHSHHKMGNLERAMSLLPHHLPMELPSDIAAVHLEATEHVPTKADPTTVHLDIVIDRKVPIIGYAILFGGLFALSSVGAALDLQKGGVTPIMKTLWRQMATCMSLLPLCVMSLRSSSSGTSKGFLPHLTPREWILLPVAAATYTYMTLSFVLALEMTTLANAFVLSNMTSLVLIATRAVLGLPVLLGEGAGAVIGFAGAAICAASAPVVESNHVSTSPESSAAAIADMNSSSSDPNLAMLGNLLALSASFGTAGYLLIAKKLRPKVDLFLFMFLVMGLGASFLLIFVLVLGTQPVTFDMHPVHGLFGWLNLQSDRLPLELYMAVICNCLGTMGYIAVLKYFDAIVPAVVMLLEPAVGALLGVAAGTSPLPGLQTWLGDLVVAIGTFLVIRAGSSKTESIDATKALRTRVDDKDDVKSLVLANGNGQDDCSAKVVWDISSTTST